MVRESVRRKETPKKLTLDYKEIDEELKIQSEIPVKMIAMKEDLNNLEAKILLENLQNSILKTFGSAEISHKSNNGERNKDGSTNLIKILDDRMQLLEMENSFSKMKFIN